MLLVRFSTDNESLEPLLTSVMKGSNTLCFSKRDKKVKFNQKRLLVY